MIISLLNRKKWLIPVLLFLLNFILKIIYLDYGNISGDEPFTIYHSQSSILEILNLLKNGNNPPLPFLLMHFWIYFFGISAFSVRFLPLIFSSLTVIYIYKIGNLSFNKNVAVLASLIFTFSNYHMFFAHEARVYALFALLTSISMYYFLLLTKNNKSLYIIILSLINTLLIYAHFFGFFVIFIQIISIIFIPKIRKSSFLKYIYSLILLIIFYIPYFPIFLNRFLESSTGTWIEAPTSTDLYINLWKFSNAPVTTVFFILLLLSGLFLFIKRFRKNKKLSSDTLIIFIWFFIPYITMFIISYKLPLFLDRYLIYISIGYYLLIAVIINYLSKNNRVFYIIASFSIILMIASFKIKENNNRNKKTMINQFIIERTNQTPVFICPDWNDLGIAYYYNINFFKDYKNTRKLLNKDNIFPINNVTQINDSLINKYNKATYIDGWAQLVDKKGLILKKLKDNYKHTETNNTYKGYTIYEFYN